MGHLDYKSNLIRTSGTLRLHGASNGTEIRVLTIPASESTRQADAAVDDAELVQVSGHVAAAFERLMRRYNGRLFRAARSILKDDAEAEDAVQDAYLQAYRHIDDFRGDAQLATWLTRIVVNQALLRLRSKKRDRNVVSIAEGRAGDARGAHAEIADDSHEPPPQAAFRAEVRRLIEQKIDDLPVAFRTVFVLRDIEDLTVQETADCLSIPPATVRTRLFRARALLRESLAQDLDSATVEVFGFAGSRCDRIVSNVLARLARA